MTEESKNIKEEFLYPIGNYYGEFTPENWFLMPICSSLPSK